MFSDPNERRFKETLAFLEKSVGPPPLRILDVGVRSLLAEKVESLGYTVTNTQGEDLDNDTSAVAKQDADVVTAFEVLEHMVAPYNLLRAIRAPKLIATVPLRLWFATAYWNDQDPRDCHFHEFESRQFDMLLWKAGWRILQSEQWISPAKTLGFRSLLRAITPRYYAVYCERLESDTTSGDPLNE